MIRLVIKPLTRNAPAPKGFWGRLMIRKMNIGHAKMTAWAFEQLNLQMARAVVDIGCGGGKAVKRLASLAPEAVIYVWTGRRCAWSRPRGKIKNMSPPGVW